MSDTTTAQDVKTFSPDKITAYRLKICDKTSFNFRFRKNIDAPFIERLISAGWTFETNLEWSAFESGLMRVAVLHCPDEATTITPFREGGAS